MAVRNLNNKRISPTVFPLLNFNLAHRCTNLSRSQSTARMMVTSSAGRPTVSNTMTIVTSPAWGIPAAPMLAIVAVIEIAMIWPMLSSISRTCEMKIAATASYRAVPSMLIVAPMGRTNLQTRRITLYLIYSFKEEKLCD